jgi:plastocyanin
MRFSFSGQPASALLAAVSMAILLALPQGKAAAAVTVQVLDMAGVPVANAVVYAEPVGGQAVTKSQKQVEIEQKDVKFSPLVSVVQVGTPILFPNHDKVRHHVYSFSPAKTFELKLYAGVPTNPVLFDKPGTVVLGCNIHDQMVAYVQVVNTPYFGKTDMAGRVKLDGLSNGKYVLKTWYFGMPPTATPLEQALNYQGADLAASVKLGVKAVPVE